ncbi:Dimer-Tnp-hAT dimerization containing protein [Pyrenophora tritici-repentis]|nr:Dimer-Tnp-hAT dimerization containing protein [Pyrenophora tritici-repentis]
MAAHFLFFSSSRLPFTSTAASKIHVSFDGWTTKGGKRGFFGVVAHYATATGDVRDVAIDLPHLAGVHSGERIASCINQVLMKFGITSTTLGYFVLDNAYTNDAAVAKLSAMYNFSARQRRLRCAPHTLNLVGQSLIFGSNPDSYDNAFAEHNDEEHFMHEWREQGPLGVLLSIIKYIKTPQQYTLFETFQAHANAELPADERQKILEPVKPVATRWNSFSDSYARTHNNKMSDAPTWMRSNGLSASDWQVITKYIRVLRPLKEATLRLEGRGKAGRFGAIYEVIPVFEYLLNEYEARVKSYEHVDYEAANAPEDHLAINLRAAWAKLNEYYSKLDDLVVYYAAVTLHPYYKRYCERSWRDKSDWLRSLKQNFQQLWATYKPVATSPKHRKARLPNAIDDAIAALADDDSSDNELMDEYELWSRLEPKWTSQQFATNGHPIRYWLSLRSKYPHLHRFAIDVLTIPASSCECERMFSDLGDLLEPRRRKIGAQLLAALQCIRAWMKVGVKVPPRTAEKRLTDDEIDHIYSLCEWDKPLE